MSESLVTIASYWFLDDAMIARNALDGAGIESFLDDENIVAVNWFNANAVHGVKLRVRNVDALVAAEVLESQCQSLDEVDEPDETIVDPDVCPACGSREVQRTPRALMFFAIAALTFGIGVAVGETATAFFAILATALFLLIWDRQKCADCGESWN